MDVPPFYFLTQFVTYQECNPEVKLVADSILTVSDFHNNRFTLRMKPCGDSINFVYVDTCRVNGYAVPVNQYFYLGDSVVIEYDQAFANPLQNKISVKGSYQEVYNDRVLGLRYRTVAYGNEGNELSKVFVSAETKAVGRQFLCDLIGLLLAVLAFIIVWRKLVILRIFVNGKRFSIRRKAMKRLKNDDFTLVTIAFDKYGMPNALFYKGNGISIKDDNKTQRNGRLLKISSFRELSLSSPLFRVKKEDSLSVIEFDADTVFNNLSELDNKIQFSYANRLSHNLIISFEKQHDFEIKTEENKLRDCNIGMLARYYEEHAMEIKKTRNNVQVNIIRKEAFNKILGDDYKLDYAILNIYDLNCRNRANHIFLRCSIVCNFNGNQSDADVTKKLLQVAEKNILKGERQKLGFFAAVAYKEEPEDETGVEVDASPMLTYLYLLKEGEEGKRVKTKKSRLVYSPFVDGRSPLLDGRPGLTSKTVQIYSNSVMTLLNLPVKYKKPAAKKKFGDEESFNLRRKKSETLYFKGADKIRFLDKELNFSNGRLEGGVTNTWSLDSLVF